MTTSTGARRQPVHRDDINQFIAIDQLTRTINEKYPVAIAIKRDAQVCR